MPKKLTASSKLSSHQLLVAQVYANGEFAHVRTWEDVTECGDSLFRFVMGEAHDADGDVSDLTRMMMTGIEQLQDLHHHLMNNLDAVPAKKAVPARIEKIVKDKSDKVHVVIQEGESRELFVHTFEEKRRATAHRNSCAKASYRTTPSFPVARAVADAPGFVDAIEASALAMLDLSYPAKA
jgi:hypothetical protein